MQYFQERRLEKLASRASKSTTSVIVHLNGLPAIVEHTAAKATWQDRDTLCIPPDDTTLADGILNGTASSTPNSIETRQKKERSSDVTVMSTGP